MNRYFILISLLLMAQYSKACTVCEKQQPKILRGISHGTGPESNWDIVIVITTAIVVLLTLFYSIKWLIKPGEKSDTHIKRLFIEEQI